MHHFQRSSFAPQIASIQAIMVSRKAVKMLLASNFLQDPASCAVLVSEVTKVSKKL